MKNKETLINKIKTNRIKTKELEHSIHQQETNIMKMVSDELTTLGIPHDYRKGEKYLNINPTGEWILNREIRISFGGGNFHIQFPHIINQMNCYFQIQVFKILSKFENELTDLQLDYLAMYECKDRNDVWELEQIVNEELFNKLETDGVLKVNGETYKMTKGEKGRYNITFPYGYTKSLFKTNILDKLLHETKDVVRVLVQN